MKRLKKSCSALILPSPDLSMLLPVNRLPNKLASNVTNKISRNFPFCSFTSLLIVLLIYFINKLDPSEN